VELVKAPAENLNAAIRKNVLHRRRIFNKIHYTKFSVVELVKAPAGN
jgi:hypothetical protein